MRTSTRGLDLIKSFQGLRLQSYLDYSNVFRIGYGTTLGVVAGMLIDVQQAESMLLDDVQRLEPEIQRLIIAPLSQNQWDALISFTHNQGVQSLASSSLRQLLNAGNYAGAAEQFPRWSRASGKDVPSLVRLRAAERELFLTTA